MSGYKIPTTNYITNIKRSISEGDNSRLLQLGIKIRDKRKSDALMDLLKAGEKAPNFELVDSSGKLHKLSDYFGKKVILYFYPKDDTPGCTRQACDFTEHKTEFDEKNATVIGISADDSDSHAKFEEKYGLSILLLSDMAKEACKAYGTLQMKEFAGKRFLGIERTTYIIDEFGIVKKIFPKVKPEGHWETLLQSI